MVNLSVADNSVRPLQWEEAKHIKENVIAAHLIHRKQLKAILFFVNQGSANSVTPSAAKAYISVSL